MPVDRRKLLKAANDALDAGLSVTAAWKASELLKHAPEDLEALEVLGQAKLDENELESARTVFERALRLAPLEDGTYFRWLLATTLAGLGDRRRAESLLREAVRDDPDSELGWMELIPLLRLEGDTDGAVKAAREAFEKCKGERRATVLMEAASAIASVDAEEAIQLVDEGLRLEPEMKALSVLRKDLESLLRAMGKKVPDRSPGPATEEEPAEPKGTGILTANIEREFFAAVAAGTKTVEYRTASEYWRRRIEKAGPTPIKLRLINGMRADSPELTVVVEKILENFWEAEYELHLGKVLTVKNWP